MRKAIILLAVMAATFAAGAYAAPGWHVFANAQDSGDYGAYASASASATRVQGLAVRVSKNADVSWTISCDGTTTLAANRVLVLGIAPAGTCRVYASANTDTSGLLRVQLLKR